MAKHRNSPRIDDNHLINRWPGNKYIAERAFRGKMFRGIGDTIEEAIDFCEQAIMAYKE